MSFYSKNFLTQSYLIGDFSFTLGITRVMAVEGFEQNSKYWDLLENPEYKELSTNYEKYFLEMANNKEKILKFYKFKEQIVEEAIPIVEYLLPLMLQKGQTNIGEYKSYEEYSQALLKFCFDNEILFDNHYEDENSEDIFEDGFYTVIMTFINKGFTYGSSQSKPKVKITAR